MAHCERRLRRPLEALSGRAEWTILALIVAGALLVRLYHLGSFPDTVVADEADNAQSAVRILHHQPPDGGFFGLDWTAQPALSAYKEAAFIKVFGFTVAALRLPSALISAASLVPFHVLLRRQLSAAPSLLGTLLLATGVWYLNFSRSGWNVIDICFYMLAAMVLLLRGLDAYERVGVRIGAHHLYFVGAGLFAALGLYGYPAGRAITLALLAFSPVAVALRRTMWRRVVLGFALLFAAEAVTFAPEAVFLAQHWHAFNGRTDVVRITSSPEYQADRIGTMLHQINLNLRGPWDGAVNNTPQYTPAHEPQLDRLTGVLTLTGMATTFLVRRFRRREETWLWWLMLFASWVLTQLFTVGTPNGVRGIGLVPPLVYFAAVGVSAALAGAAWLGNRARSPRWTRQVATAAICIVVVVGACLEVRHYVQWQRQPKTRQARYLYVTAREFKAWAADVVAHAAAGERSTNVGQWRVSHPLRNVANPYGKPS